jgi:hypothetical protein
VAHPNFKSGKYSRYLKNVPAELKAGYVAGLKDEEITSIKEELAVCTALIQRRLEDLKSRQVPPWGTVVEALNSFKVAPDEEKAERFADLEKAIRTGFDAWDGEQQIINDIRELLQERSRLAAIEHRREVDLRCLVPVETAYAFLARIMQAMKETITDPAMFRRLNQRVMQLIPPYLFSGCRSIELIHQWPAAGVSAAAIPFVETVAASEPEMGLLFGEGDGTRTRNHRFDRQADEASAQDAF